MAKNSINIDEQSLYEWIYSVGYLLPSNELELARFETLHPAAEIKINEECIDPFAIIHGTRQKKALSFTHYQVDESTLDELRMAARKHQNLPADIIARIRKNQQSDDQPDRSENS